MRELPGKVAVVTGAASGIGLAMTQAFLAEGMKVAMADVDPVALDEAAGHLAAGGADVLPVVTDVRDDGAVESLAEAVYERYGAAHVLCNNAGVSAAAAPWELTAGEWKWVLDVNLWGVINGTRAFVPRMIEQGEGHVVNTASLAGLITGILSAYSVSKHAVVALSESTYLSLRLAGHPIGVSVLCPGFVKTRIWESERNRPADIQPDRESDGLLHEAGRALVQGGIDPAEVGAAVVDAIKDDRFYILTHPGSEGAVEVRLRDILEGRPPTPPAIL
ncbi:MAG TPA: SDR family NAD(P)-dependent oxidoreductase [Candidatus Dormibacteraeota bacterium]